MARTEDLVTVLSPLYHERPLHSRSHMGSHSLLHLHPSYFIGCLLQTPSSICRFSQEISLLVKGKQNVRLHPYAKQYFHVMILTINSFELQKNTVSKHQRLKSCKVLKAKCFPGTLTLGNTFLSKIYFKSLTQLNRTDNMACYIN